MIAHIESLDLTENEYELAKQGKHPKFEVNKAVIDMLNRTEQIRGIVTQRALIKAGRAKNKALDQTVTINFNPEENEQSVQAATNRLHADAGIGIEQASVSEED